MTSQLSKGHAANSRQSTVDLAVGSDGDGDVDHLPGIASSITIIVQCLFTQYVLTYCIYSRVVGLPCNVRRSEFKLLFSVKLVRTSYDLDKLWGGGYNMLHPRLTKYRRPQWR